MELHPPIQERSTHDLIVIVSSPDFWQPEAVSLAQVELEKRNFPVAEQEKVIRKLESDYAAETKCELKKRALVKYNPLQLFCMFIHPFGALLSDWYLKTDGYTKMYKQRLWTIAAGFAFYAFCLIYVSLAAPYQDKEMMKQIEAADISEWEKSYYGETSDTASLKPDK